MRKAGLFGVVLLPSVVLFPLDSALGQSADDAVTVTATRVERPSLEVPASIDRVTAEDIRFARPQVNLSESLGRVPGIVVSNRQNYAQDLQVQSRGFGARSTFGIRGLRLMADGIPASMPDGQGQASTFDLGSAERIEVLRGPFSVMYGNSSGGVINVLTESGADNPGVQGELWGGSYGTWKSALKAGGGTRERDWLADLSHFETDGYREHSAAKRDQLNAKLGFGLGAGTRLGLVINSLDSPEVQDPLGLTRAQMLADPRSVDPGAIAFDTRKSVRQNQAGATLSHQLGGGTLAASAYAGHRTVRQYLSIPLATQNANTHSGGVVDLDRDYAGASLRYSVELAVPVTLVFGGEYERQAERRRGYINNFGSIGALKRDEDDTVDSTGVFAQAEWRFARDWLLLAGVRSSRVEFESTDYFVRPAAPPANNGDDSGSVSYSATTPALGLLYKLAPTASLYANYGEGFETPTFAELAYQNNNQPGLNFGLQASKSRHAEAGVKWVAGSRGRVNFAAFLKVERPPEFWSTTISFSVSMSNTAKLTRPWVPATHFTPASAWRLLEACRPKLSPAWLLFWYASSAKVGVSKPSP